RRYADYILRRIGEDAAPHLLQGSRDTVGRTQLHILSLLSLIDGDSPVNLKPLADALKSRYLNTRMNAVRILGGFGKRALPVLVTGLKVNDPDKRVAVEALRQICQLGEKAEAAIPAVTAALKN